MHHPHPLPAPTPHTTLLLITNGPINAHLTIAHIMPKYNQTNEKQEALLQKFRQNTHISAVAQQLNSTTKLFVNAINMYVTFNLLFLEKQTLFKKITFYVAPATNQIKRIRQKSYKSGELFNKHFCKIKILLSPMRQ